MKSKTQKKMKMKNKMKGGGFGKDMMNMEMMSMEDQMISNMLGGPPSGLSQHELDKGQQELEHLQDYFKDSSKPLQERRNKYDTWKGKYGSYLSGTLRVDNSLYLKDYVQGPDQNSVPLTSWGGIGGMGFELYDINGNKYWIDVDTDFNLIKGIQEGPYKDQKQLQLMAMPEADRVAFNVLRELWPEGFKATSPQYKDQVKLIFLTPENTKQGDAILEKRRAAERGEVAPAAAPAHEGGHHHHNPQAAAAAAAAPAAAAAAAAAPAPAPAHAAHAHHPPAKGGMKRKSKKMKKSKKSKKAKKQRKSRKSKK